MAKLGALLGQLSSSKTSTTVNSSVPKAMSANETPLINDPGCKVGDSKMAGMQASNAAT